jgi:hypothetical protein
MDEFETCINTMLQMYNDKKKAYGSEEDSLQNFYDISNSTGCGVLGAAEVLLGKHQSYIKKFLNNNLSRDKYSDDAYLDRAVYAVLAYVLYQRGEEECYG